MSNVSFLPRLILLSALVAVLIGCAEDPSSPFYDYENAPALGATILSMEIKDDKLEVIAEIINENESEEIEVAGVAIGDQESFDFFSARKIISDSITSDGRFFLALDSLPVNETIFLVAFVGQSESLGRSDVSSISTVGIEPPEAPCEYPLNQMLVYTTPYRVSGTRQYFTGFGEYRVEFGASSAEMWLDFPETFSDGIYETVSFNQFNNFRQERDAYVRSRAGFINFVSLVPGGKIYVTELPNGQVQLEGCELYIVFQRDTFLQQFNVILN